MLLYLFFWYFVMSHKKIVIVGGGAAGFFAAINIAEMLAQHRKSAIISIIEASDSLLKKVKISGGGRCNVTHHQFDEKMFCQNYPRGHKELISSMQRFQAKDTVSWFQKQGIEIVAEDDGRMFPVTNSSETIIRCFLDLANKYNIQIRKQCPVTAISRIDDSYLLSIKNHPDVSANVVMIATGSSPSGHRLATELGHTITELAPSLFSFKIADPLIHDLSGLSFEHASLKMEVPNSSDFKESGPLLITHWGLSGPAVLKISAWAARELMHVNYIAKLVVNWLGVGHIDEVTHLIRTLKDTNARSKISNAYPDGLAQRFWLKLLFRCEINSDKCWADITKAEIHQLSITLFATEFTINGKNRYKDEFVECGGVNLKEINFKTMESKISSGLYFSGEVLDIDGITGGFNFQNAWTGSWIAAQNIAETL